MNENSSVKEIITKQFSQIEDAEDVFKLFMQYFQVINFTSLTMTEMQNLFDSLMPNDSSKAKIVFELFESWLCDPNANYEFL